MTPNKTKFHNLHIVKKKQCPPLKVHGDIRNKVDQIKYLGDEIDKSGKNKATIEKRKANGFGIASDITAITDDIPLGQWRLQAGLMLRPCCSMASYLTLNAGRVRMSQRHKELKQTR